MPVLLRLVSGAIPLGRSCPTLPHRNVRAKTRSQSAANSGTLADARAYAIKRNPGTTDRAWQHAMKLMIEAADGGNLAAATKQLELALLIDGALWMAKAN